MKVLTSSLYFIRLRDRKENSGFRLKDSKCYSEFHGPFGAIQEETGQNCFSWAITVCHDERKRYETFHVFYEDHSQ
ncbi:hypothetical protein RRG08_003250 [Elysia crispata]|uniref:Uncharacterized protein n=1 Tax=Elysia crispata TaxID=231223 RepID=A0AAE1AZ27_9GAST|nr:hypothetical protein RRG08_003250 [Elysia crispata]